MSLTIEQINLISLIDQKVKSILIDGGNEISIMIELLDEMPKIKTVIDSADKEELNKHWVLLHIWAKLAMDYKLCARG